MRILVTNDDGYDQPGLRCLVERLLADHGDAVWVVAPFTEHSGASAAVGAMHLDPPVVREVTVPGVLAGQAWAVEGPPALGVLLARLGTFGPPPDLVVSGINPGLNTGRAVYHSGTIGAALTARNGGISGIAVSQQIDAANGPHPVHPASAAEVAARAVAAIIADPPDEPAVLNINVPDRPIDDIAGARLCDVGTRPAGSAVGVTLEPRGDGSHSVTFEFVDGGPGDDPAHEVDTVVVADGSVALTWLGKITLTDPGDRGVVASIVASMPDRPGRQ